MIVTIDGPAGSGKSTIAKLIAQKTGALFLNSGSFYRGVTLAWLRTITAPSAIDKESLLTLASGLQIDYVDERLHINGEDVDDLLHSDEVDKWVSQVSSIPELRDIVNVNLKKIAAKRNVVCDGRDMSTVVFPHAEYQFYLDANRDVQAQRRFNQGVSGLSLKEIRASIRERDERDKKKAVGALKIAENACYIDTSHLTIIEVCDIILCKITSKE